MKGNWIYEIDAPPTDLQEVRHWTARPCPFWLTMCFILFAPVIFIVLMIASCQ